MKITLQIVTLLLMCQVVSYSQRISDISFGVGVRSHFGGMQPFKDVLTYYNDNRPWLDNEFATRRTINGLEFGLEASGKNIGLSFLKVYRLGTKRVAKGVDLSGEEFKRTIKLRIIGIDLFDIWYTPIHVGSINIGGGIMPFGLGIIRTRTKYNDEEQVKLAMSSAEGTSKLSLLKSDHMYAQFHIDITNGDDDKNSSWHLQIFYAVADATEYDLYYLNKEINPSTYPNIKRRTLLSPDSFGLKLMYTFK